MKSIARKAGFILALAFLLLPIFETNAQTTSNTNAGFVKANIWYSKEPFFEGDKIKIYTFVFNPDKRELKGTVIFFDKSIFLGKADFVASANSVKNVSIDWTVTAGDHEIFAKIENARFKKADGTFEDVYLLGNETEKSESKVAKTIVPVAPKKEVDLKAQAGGVSDIDTSLPSMSVAKITDTIVGITPDFIANPVIAGANKLEDIREKINIATVNKKDEVKKEVEALKNTGEIKKDSKKTSEAKDQSKLLKPWKQVQLFFLGIFAFIFGSKFFFYTFWIVLILLIIRFIRRRFS